MMFERFLRWLMLVKHDEAWPVLQEVVLPQGSCRWTADCWSRIMPGPHGISERAAQPKGATEIRPSMGHCQRELGWAMGFYHVSQRVNRAATGFFGETFLHFDPGNL